ncbi:MAG TPA: NAD-dependent epimerase/dehydratase family protein [Longimicrobiaceae bacterium]|nr:NAD-dependent epimerase/dehydratase family protein [Longimicrobiaceae bacterium]
MTATRALILGCGYVGGRLARALAADGVSVTGTTRDPARFAAIAAAGATPARMDAMEPATLDAVLADRPDVVFDCIRPLRTGPDAFTVENTRRIVDALVAHRPGAVVYVSSTSVYGRRAGEWTDEETPLDPVSPAGLSRAEAERLYFAAFRDAGLPARVCRVPGIYGPGRTLRGRLETGAYLRLDDESHHVSRIHVDDLVAGLLASWRRGVPGGVYLLCDDRPVSGAEYAEITARLLGIPLPTAVARADIRHELTSSAWERRTADRRCSNRRMRLELGVALRYPTVHQGVPAALAEEGAI